MLILGNGKMNMAIRGIDADFGPYQADTFTKDLHPTLKADFILANPPFNYHHGIRRSYYRMVVGNTESLQRVMQTMHGYSI